MFSYLSGNRPARNVLPNPGAEVAVGLTNVSIWALFTLKLTNHTEGEASRHPVLVEEHVGKFEIFNLFKFTMLPSRYYPGHDCNIIEMSGYMCRCLCCDLKIRVFWALAYAEFIARYWLTSMPNLGTDAGCNFGDNTFVTMKYGSKSLQVFLVWPC